MLTRDIADALAGDPTAPGVQLRKGVVSAVAADGITVSVKIGGSDTAIDGVFCLNSYLPAVNDVVNILQSGPSLVVAGKAGQPDSARRDVIMRANSMMSGGGIVLVEQGHVRWTARFISIALGRGNPHSSVHGHFDIHLPAAGTVIPGAFGTADVTVTPAGYIPLGSWQAVYFIPNFTDHLGSLTIVTYNSQTNFVVPSHWIFVCGRNGDDGRVRFGNGQIYDYWRNVSYQNGWTTYDANHHPAQFMRTADGIVQLRGLIKGGTMGATAFTLPAGYRIKDGPDTTVNNVHLPCVSSSAFGAVWVRGNGEVQPAVGSNTWFDLGSISYLAEQ